MRSLASLALAFALVGWPPDAIPGLGVYGSPAQGHLVLMAASDDLLGSDGSTDGGSARSVADLSALDEMLHGSKGRLQRWTHAPELVVLQRVMEYRGEGGAESVATDEMLADAEVDALVADLTGALSMLTGNTYDEFAAIHRESLEPGSHTTLSRPGQIVVGRFRGVRTMVRTIGFGGRSARADGTITSGAIVLDSEYDRTSDLRRLLRTHELGHALGYNHVQSQVSIMNPRIGTGPTDFDRMAVRVAFESSQMPSPNSATARR